MTAIEFNYKLTSLQDNLQHFANKLTANEDDAKDLLQDTFVKALIYKDKFVRHSNFKAWVYTIMKNTFINNYRRNKRKNTFLDATPNYYHLNNPAEENQQRPDTAYSVKELQEGIKSLDPDYRRAFEMYNAGYKYKEIADKLDLSIGTVKSRIFFIRKKLAENLQEYQYN